MLHAEWSGAADRGPGWLTGQSQGGSDEAREEAGPMSADARRFVLVCRTVAGLAVGVVSLYPAVVLGTLGGAWTEYYIGGIGIPLGIAATVVGVMGSGYSAARAAVS